MKLKEALESLKGENVKVGANSSFIFCAKVDDNTIDTIDKMAQLEKVRLKGYLASLHKANDTFVSRWQSRQYANFKTYIREQANDRKRIDDGLREIPKKIKNFKMYSEREVNEMYPSFEGGTIIIFEGDESGQYWTYDEYKSGRGKVQNDDVCTSNKRM